MTIMMIVGLVGVAGGVAIAIVALAYQFVKRYK